MPIEVALASSGITHLGGHALHLRLHCLQEARPEAVVIQAFREAVQYSCPEPECAAAQVAPAFSVAFLLILCTLQQLADVNAASAVLPEKVLP